jgi:hypothetical protein
MQEGKGVLGSQKALILGIAGLTVLALFLGYWLYFAGWMTAYYSDPGLISLWQTRFYWLLAALLLSCAGDLCLVVKAVRNRRTHRPQ